MFNKIKNNFLRMIVRGYCGVVAGIVGGIITSLLMTVVMKATGDDLGVAYLVSPAMMAVGALLGGVLSGIYGIVHNKEE